MRRIIVMASLLAGFTASIHAAANDWSRASPISVEMSSYRFSPSTLTLQHGQAYRIRFHNGARKAHNFVAKDFFVSAIIAPADVDRIKNGAVDLRGGETADVQLIPNARGTFKVHCSHFMHSPMGMKGTIVVR